MTQAELAILSLVAEKPRHGYEIEQIIEERGMREWTELSFSSIYYLLKKLEQQELVESRLEEAERGPARKVYEATPEGRAALKVGVLEALSTPAHCYPPIQLGLANLPVLSREEALEALQEYRETLQERQALLQAERESQQPLPYFVDAMFEYSLRMMEAEQEWVTDFTATVEQEMDLPPSSQRESPLDSPNDTNF